MSDVVTEPPGWSTLHGPADATQATISRAAETLGRHVCRHISVSLSGAANATAITFVLRNGASGAGGIVWLTKVNNIANESKSLNFVVNIVGSKNTAMTLESTGAPAASSAVTVAMDGYTDYGPV